MEISVKEALSMSNATPSYLCVNPYFLAVSSDIISAKSIVYVNKDGRDYCKHKNSNQAAPEFLFE